jgi:hypothetical protein
LLEFKWKLLGIRATEVCCTAVFSGSNETSLGFQVEFQLFSSFSSKPDFHACH